VTRPLALLYKGWRSQTRLAYFTFTYRRSHISGKLPGTARPRVDVVDCKLSPVFLLLRWEVLSGWFSTMDSAIGLLGIGLLLSVSICLHEFTYSMLIRSHRVIPRRSQPDLCLHIHVIAGALGA
jgi:hypothetical protein